jgi:amidophosphoribosyltransferase
MIDAVDVPFRKTGEDCGVVAVWRRGGAAAELVHRALFALQHRGQEAAGICTYSQQPVGAVKTSDGSGKTSGKMHHLKGRGLVVDALPVHRTRELPGDRAIGHVRYSTVTMDRAENIQPFTAQTPYGQFAVAHNGNLKNQDELARELEAAGSLLSTSMDTELMVHLLARSKATNFPDGLRIAAASMKGAYSLTMLCDGRLYALRDTFGVRPLVLGEHKDGWVVASETAALEAVDAKYVREIEPGELVEISAEGVRSTQLLPKAPPAPCVFELVYFARPNSEVFGQNAHQARLRMGEQLAIEDQAAGVQVKPDIIVPIPDSGMPAAIGYSRRSGIPLEQAIIRSHYVGRTFILPDQDSRSHSIRMKLSVIKDAVRGKRVCLIDDSIVRGNTSRLIVQMVRDAGAAEVWMRIASPPLSWPCYLGIDTPSREELVINRHADIDGVRRAVGADNLRYLSLDGLKNATKRQEFCFACMTGTYPV